MNLNQIKAAAQAKQNEIKGTSPLANSKRAFYQARIDVVEYLENTGTTIEAEVAKVEAEIEVLRQAGKYQIAQHREDWVEAVKATAEFAAEETTTEETQTEVETTEVQAKVETNKEEVEVAKEVQPIKQREVKNYKIGHSLTEGRDGWNGWDELIHKTLSNICLNQQLLESRKAAGIGTKYPEHGMIAMVLGVHPYGHEIISVIEEIAEEYEEQIYKGQATLVDRERAMQQALYNRGLSQEYQELVVNYLDLLKGLMDSLLMDEANRANRNA